MKTEDSVLSRGVADIIVGKDFEALLHSKKKLRIKHGVDPTRPDLHLGHAVIYRKLKAFQDLGHTIIFLIGDFTGRFGDPTDKTKSRMMHSKKEVEEASKSYVEQIGKILDKKKLEIRHNSEWYDKMSAEELLRIMSHFTVSRMLERDMFEKRKKASEEIGLHEPVYPVLQAYDSVMLKSDLTVIGTDQTFNELQARPLQEAFKQHPQQIVTMKILPGTDGAEKMSKTTGNDIRITAEPSDMFGKIMSIPDSAISIYAELLTDLPLADFEKPKDPRASKMHVAHAVVTWLHGEKETQKAKEHFDRVIVQKKAPDDVQVKSNPEVPVRNTVDLVAWTFGLSKSEARRLIMQNAIECDGKKITDFNESPKSGLYKKGRHYIRVELKK